MAKNKSVKKEVLKKIDDNKTKMHSSKYFAILGVATVLSAVLLTLLSAVLVRLLFDDVDEVRRAGLFGLGPEKRQFLVGGFPWGLLILTVASIWGTLKLYQKMEISYRHSAYIFYSSVAAAILVLAVIAGNPSVKGPIERAPFVDKLKTASNRLDEKTARGFLIDYEEDIISILLPDKGTLEVDIGTAKLEGEPKVGGPVLIIGEWEEDNISAEFVNFGGPKQVRKK